MNDAWFATVAGIVLLAVVTVGAVGLVSDDAEGEVWSPPEPDVYAPTEPSSPGMATVGDQTFDDLQAAVDAAEPGDVIQLEGAFSERVVIDTPGIELRTADGASGPAHIDGDGSGTVLTINASSVLIEGIWVSDSGMDRSAPDAGIMVYGANVTLERVQITDSLFGVWIHGGHDATIRDSTIIGSTDVPITERGNGIHLWEAAGAEIIGNDITQSRDGIYFQWSSEVYAADNRLWDLRYGVHYMYSDDNTLAGNLAFDNDVGFALMVSENLTIEDNVAIDNRGPSSHGILVKDIDDSVIRGNDVVNNGQGFFVYNAHNNVIEDNLILENDLGIQFTAGSSGEVVIGNSFINNERDVLSTATTRQTAWNDSNRGNFWADARTIDLDGDGTGEVRHQPAGIVEQLLHDHPESAVFTESPAFDAVRLAESSFPVLEVPGIVDHRPLTDSPHDHWRSYYDD